MSIESLSLGTPASSSFYYRYAFFDLLAYILNSSPSRLRFFLNSVMFLDLASSSSYSTFRLFLFWYSLKTLRNSVRSASHLSNIPFISSSNRILSLDWKPNMVIFSILYFNFSLHDFIWSLRSYEMSSNLSWILLFSYISASGSPPSPKTMNSILDYKVSILILAIFLIIIYKFLI